jgi:hypothetical protein
MKTWKLVIAVAVLLLAGCRTAVPYNVQNAPGTSKAVSMADVEAAIRRAGHSLGWQIVPQGPGRAEGTLVLRDHRAVVNITYDARNYSITYKDSKNLLHSGDDIHRRYNGWVKHLEDAVSLDTPLSSETPEVQASWQERLERAHPPLLRFKRTRLAGIDVRSEECHDGLRPRQKNTTVLPRFPNIVQGTEAELEIDAGCYRQCYLLHLLGLKPFSGDPNAIDSGRKQREIIIAGCVGKGAPGAGLVPEWIGIVNGTSTEQWDATDLRFYVRFSTSVSDFIYGAIRQAWPTGPLGTAKSFEPKNGDVSKCVFEFRGRFAANGDYTTSGVGLLNSTPGSPTLFSSSAAHFIQVLRNTGNWELGTCDGSTISQSASSGGADNALHDFRVEWEEGEIRLYVDDALAITKTTNLPVQPLALAMVGHASVGTFDVMGVKIRWV